MSGKHQRGFGNKNQHIETLTVNGRKVKRIVKDDVKPKQQQTTSK